MKRRDGYIKVVGGKVWYEIVGEKKSIPLIVLHGGPGYPHDYLEPLEDLSNNREVIFYDQLGCGNSDRPQDTSLWTVDRFVLELQTVIKNLELEQYHVLGHSWGAALAVSLALTKPKGLTSLILSSPYISTPRWEKDAKRLIWLLPKETQKILEKHEKDGKYDSVEYKKAAKEFHKRFVRSFPPTKAILQTKRKKNDDIYHFMWGPEEFCPKGTLKDFDPTERLPELTLSVLLLCGRSDEATPESLAYFKDVFRNAQMKVFEKSEHYSFWNERGVYMKTVQAFLLEIEK